MSTLTPFQESCWNALKRVLLGLAVEPCSFRIITGREETYIEADLGSMKAWIYRNGADWEGYGRHPAYEAPDYDSLDELQRVFIADIAAILSERGTDGRQKEGVTP